MRLVAPSNLQIAEPADLTPAQTSRDSDSAPAVRHFPAHERRQFDVVKLAAISHFIVRLSIF
jgi:hypothetical protein